MKRHLIIIVLYLIYCEHLIPQNFTIIKSAADSLLESGKLIEAIDQYRIEIKLFPDKSIKYYNIACSFAKINNIDSAFHYLNQYLNKFKNPNFLVDSDFLKLRGTTQWDSLENGIIKYMEDNAKQKYKNIELAKKLWFISAIDQQYYYEIRIAEKQFGVGTPVPLALWDFKESLNKENLRNLEILIEQFGWPKIEDVGTAASNAAFFVVQHASLTVQKKYLNTIENLAKTKAIQPQNYAFLIDKILTSEGNPQKFGTQLRFNSVTNNYELFPLMDKSSVNKLRADFELGPIEEYLERWDITNY